MSVNEEEFQELKDSNTEVFEQAEELISLEKQLTELSIEWSNKILALKNELSDEEFDKLRGVRTMLVDLDEEMQNKKEELHKLKGELEAIKNASQNRSEEQE